MLLKWHATFTPDGHLEGFVPIIKMPEYWLKKNDARKASYAYLYNGILSDNPATFKQAAIYYNEAQKLAMQQKDSLLIFYTYYYQGKLFLKNREFNNGEIALQKALQHSHAIDRLETPHYLMQVAECYLYVHNYEKANAYYTRALLKTDDSRDSVMTVRTLYQASRNIRDKAIKEHIAEYLKYAQK